MSAGHLCQTTGWPSVVFNTSINTSKLQETPTIRHLISADNWGKMITRVKSFNNVEQENCNICACVKNCENILLFIELTIPFNAGQNYENNDLEKSYLAKS
jgi:hypothetical protein